MVLEIGSGCAFESAWRIEKIEVGAWWFVSSVISYHICGIPV